MLNIPTAMSPTGNNIVKQHALKILNIVLSSACSAVFTNAIKWIYVVSYSSLTMTKVFTHECKL